MEPELLSLAAILRIAIRDALQDRNECLRDEARRWLWRVVPSVARMAEVSAVGDSEREDR